MRRDEVLLPVTTPVNAVLSQTSRHERTHITHFHLYEAPRISTFTETESKIEITSGYREAGHEWSLFNGYQVSVGVMKSSDDYYTTL